MILIRILISTVYTYICICLLIFQKKRITILLSFFLSWSSVRLNLISTNYISSGVYQKVVTHLWPVTTLHFVNLARFEARLNSNRETKLRFDGALCICTVVTNSTQSIRHLPHSMMRSKIVVKSSVSVMVKGFFVLNITNWGRLVYGY